jgi:hypothetical protein
MQRANSGPTLCYCAPGAAALPTATVRRLSGVRPTLEDVERLAQGEGTRRRGIGSRRVPHRLNLKERASYELALRTGFALMDGTGHRRHAFAAGAPLLNIMRQRADALALPLVWVERHREGELWHACVDYSPVRAVDADVLQELHGRTLRVAVAKAIVWASVDPPWPEGTGSDSVLVEQAELLSQPIWALPACTARFGFCRGLVEQQKQCKRFARALADEFQTGVG